VRPCRRETCCDGEVIVLGCREERPPAFATCSGGWVAERGRPACRRQWPDWPLSPTTVGSRRRRPGNRAAAAALGRLEEIARRVDQGDHPNGNPAGSLAGLSLECWERLEGARVGRALRVGAEGLNAQKTARLPYHRGRRPTRWIVDSTNSQPLHLDAGCSDARRAVAARQPLHRLHFAFGASAWNHWLGDCAKLAQENQSPT